MMLVFYAIALSATAIYAALVAILVIDGARGGPEPIMVAVAQIHPESPICAIASAPAVFTAHYLMPPVGRGQSQPFAALPAPHPFTSDSERS